MKLSASLLLPVLIPSLASASLFGGPQKVLDEAVSVPGESPLEFCSSTEDYSLRIEKVDLIPNPPKAGQKLTIEAKGEFTKEVHEGAYINVVVKYGLIKLINLRLDLCEQMKAVDEDCPLIGNKTITKDVNLPAEVPPGSYTVFADAHDDSDEDHITCLTAHIHF